MYKIITSYTENELQDIIFQLEKEYKSSQEIPSDVKKTIFMCKTAFFLVFLIMTIQIVTDQPTRSQQLNILTSFICIFANIIGSIVLIYNTAPYVKEKSRRLKNLKYVEEILGLFLFLSNIDVYAKVLPKKRGTCKMSLYDTNPEGEEKVGTVILNGKHIKYRSGETSSITAKLEGNVPVIIITDSEKETCHDIHE